MWIHVNLPVLDSNSGFHSVDTDAITMIFIEFSGSWAGVMATLKGGKTVALYRRDCGQNGKDSITEARRIKDEIVSLWRFGCKHAEIRTVNWPSDIPKTDSMEDVKVYGDSPEAKAA